MSSQVTSLLLPSSKRHLSRHTTSLFRRFGFSTSAMKSALLSGLNSPMLYRRKFSTASTSDKRRVAVTLYRQLLRWCDSTENDIPLSFYIPPIHLEPPEVNDHMLASLAADSRVVDEGDRHGKISPSMLPANTTIDLHQLTCTVQNSADVRAFFRTIFRMNASQPSAELQRYNISLGFEALRSLNELTQALEDLKQSRESHNDRKDVRYKVGQVVRHNVEQWRGVIVGWERSNDTQASQPDQPTSLTSKSYTLDPSDLIKYIVILDSGDAHMHYTKRREQGDFNTSEVHQSDLTLVEDESLCRIRSTQTAEHFSHFDSKSNSFIPNEMKSYEFPLDQLDEASIRSHNTVAEEASSAVIMGVKEAADYLTEIILKSTPDAHEKKILAFFLESLKSISDGDVIPIPLRYSSPEPSSDKLACFYLQSLLKLVTNVSELLVSRRQSKESGEMVKFSLGDVVQHKVYGFRGVVVAWDPKPAVDVSRWDGLQHISNPQNYPFYHIIPDQSDCIQAFGGERPSRYVCQENLTACPSGQRNIEVDLEPVWEFDQESRTYIPPPDLKFKHGEETDDDFATEKCLIEMKDVLSRLLVSSRDGSTTGNNELDYAASKLSINTLLQLLRTVDSMNDAVIISEHVKEVWKAHINDEFRWKLDQALGQLFDGDTVEASDSFRALLDDDPTYAEAWNKRATCEFMMGNIDASLEASKKALEIIPTHFQALNGLGLAHFENNDMHSAAQCFQESIQLDPWSPVSSRLAACIDALESGENSHSEKK